MALVRGKLPPEALDRVLFFHSARADRLVFDTVTEIIGPMQAQGLVDINALEFQARLAKWVKEGKTSGPWSESTIVRVAQSLLSSLRDFGVLTGAMNKKIAPPFLAIEAFAYIAFYLKQHQPSGAKLLELPDWSACPK